MTDSGFQFSDAISIQLRRNSHSHRKLLLLLCNVLGFFGTIYSVLSMFSPVCWWEAIALFSICCFTLTSTLMLLPGRFHMLSPIFLLADGLMIWRKWAIFSTGAKFFYNQFYRVIHHTNLDYFEMESSIPQASSMTLFLCCCILAFSVLISQITLRQPNIFLAFFATFPLLELGLYNGIEAHPIPISMAVIYWFFVLGIQIADYRHDQGQYAMGFIRKKNVFSAQHVLRAKISALCGAVLAGLTALSFLLCGFLVQDNSLLHSERLTQTRNRLHESLSDFDLGNLSESFSAIRSSLGIGNSLLYKKLDTVGNLKYDNKTDLVVTVDELPTAPVYLKGSTASIYEENSWSVPPDRTYTEQSALNSLMQEYGCLPQTAFYNFNAAIFRQVTPYHMSIHAKNRENTCFLPYGFQNSDADFTFDYGTDLSSNRDYKVTVLQPNSYRQLAEYNRTTVSMSRSMFQENDAATNAFLNHIGIASDTDPILCDSYFDPAAVPTDEPAALIQNLLAESKVYRPFVQELDTTLPDSDALDEVYQQLQAKIAIRPLSDTATLSEQLAVLDALQAAIASQASYTLSPGTTPRNREFISYFLTENHKGYCVHFATAGTVLARYWNIPTRYCEGYVLAPEDVRNATQNANGTYTMQLTDARAHAWCEFYVAGYGWIPYEFTPGYSNGSIPDMQMTTTETIATTTRTARSTVTHTTRTHTMQATQTAAITTTVSSSPDNPMPQTQRSHTMILLVIGTAFLLLLLLASPYLFHLLQTRRCQAILYGQDPALAVLTAYEQLLAICSLFDCAPRASSKEADWIQQAAHVFAPYGVTQEELTLLAEQAQIAQFSAEPPTAAQQKQAVRTLKAIFKKLYAKASHWKRFQLKYHTHIL